MSESELEHYRRQMKEKLDALYPIFAKICTGDYDVRVEIPDDDDELSELYVGIDMMLNVIGKQFRDQKELNQTLEQKIAEKTVELRNQLDFSKTILNAISDMGEGLIIFEAESYRFTYVNKAFCDLVEYSPEELTNLPSFFSLSTYNEYVSLKAYVELHRIGFAAPKHFEMNLIRKQGSVVSVDVVIKPLATSEGSRFVALFRDITDRKREEERRIQLAQEEAARAQAESHEERAIFLSEASALVFSSLHYRSIASTLSRLAVLRIADWCAVYLTDEHGSITQLECAHTNPSKEVRMKELHSHLPTQDQGQYPVIKALKTGQSEMHNHISSAQLEDLFPNPGNRRVLLDLGFKSYMTVPIQFRGRPLGVIFLARTTDEHSFDVGDMELAEELGRRAGIALDNAHLYEESQRTKEELAKARDAAVDAAQVKSDFVASVSHEIRTPLNGIIGMANLLNDTPLSKKQREYLETMRQSSEILLNIINDILDFSKIEAGKMPIELHDFDLEDLILKTVEFLSPRAKAKKLKVNVLGADEIPAPLMGDSGRLRQVLTNLLSNAIKFTEKGGITLQINKESESDEHVTLLIRVIDTGIGISPEKLNQLFQPFSQLHDSMKRRQGGTGLGLTITKRFIELMEGEIGCESALGRGSTFWLRLPFKKSRPHKYLITPVNDPGVKIPFYFPHQDRKKADLRKARVLVAEDNNVNEKVVLMQLQKMGIKVDVVRSGAEAVKALEKNLYDLILMDCQMPEMDGYTATAKIRKREGNRRHVPIIAMTAHAMTGDRERCLKAGMDDYISKPIHPEELKAVIAKWERTREKTVIASPSLKQREMRSSMLQDLATVFVQTASQHILEIEKARKDGAWAPLERSAHALLGSAATLGFDGIASLCRQIQDQASAGCRSSLRRVTVQLKKEFMRVERFLRKKANRKRSLS